jgi:membrane protein DedA with SNARE-associated domain
MRLEEILLGHGAWWPYAVTFAWTFVEGESFVLLMGFAAAQGILSAPLLLLVAWLGSFCGDQTYFWVGRKFGLKLLARRPRWQARADKALAHVRRHSTWFILTFRFIYGVRNFASLAIGISGVPWRRFAPLNLVAALIWAVAFVGAGYFSGRAIQRLLGQYEQEFGLAVMAGFALLVIGMVMFNRFRHRRAEARLKKISPAALPESDAR